MFIQMLGAITLNIKKSFDINLHLNESESRGFPRNPDIGDPPDLLERILDVKPEHLEN